MFPQFVHLPLRVWSIAFSACLLLCLATSAAAQPSITISDVTVAEGNAQTYAVFTVTLSSPAVSTVTANFGATDGTATWPEDFLSIGGTVVFYPGQSVTTITVPIKADAFPEPTETFFVNLSNPENATIADGQGVGTITDNDVSRLFIQDAPVAEGRTRSTHAHFIVTLAPAHFATVTVNFSTANGTAVAPGDYSSLSGTLTFAPGQTIQMISVSVLGDRLSEPSETFAVNLSNPVNATIADGAGLGTIVNDDPAPDDFDGDIAADLTVFRPASGIWYTMASSTGFTEGTATAFGLTGDLPVPGDYDGDAKADIAIFRPANGTWVIRRSSTGTNVSYVWGRGTDTPVPGDYDGDGVSDLAYYRPSTGVWHVLPSYSGYDPSTEITFNFLPAAAAGIPVPADYDRDGTTDFAMFDPLTATWSVSQSLFGGPGYFLFPFGSPGDLPVPGYYDNDAFLDIAVYRPSTGEWLVRMSTTSGNPGGPTILSREWGLGDDVPVPGDYDGDARTDIAVYRPSTGEWRVLQSSTDFTTSMTIQWGAPGDIPTVHATAANAIVMARRTVANSRRTTDLDGDGRADVTVFRPSTGTWFNLRSGANYTTSATFQWGLNGDLTVPSDYDGDGVTDRAVWRPADGTWLLRFSSTGFATSAWFPWGLNGDVPVPGDYDGDGKADLAVWRPATGMWYIRRSTTGYSTSTSFQWGLDGDVPVTGDYDGDGTTDLAVWRPSTGMWYIRTSSSGYSTTLSIQLGLAGDITVPSDFDGDGTTDLAVYRPSTGVWFIRLSGAGSATVQYQWGLGADTPVPSDFDGDGRTDLAVYRPSTGAWFVLMSGSGFTTSAGYMWGQAGDVPTFRRP